MRSFLLAVLTASSTIAAPVADGEGSQAILWFRQPAPKWNEALLLGNSRLGGILFGNPADELIQLNEGTFWAGQPHDYSRPGAFRYLPELRRLIFEGKQAKASNLADQQMMGNPKFQAAYQPLGSLKLHCTLPGAVEDYRRELNLNKGVATVSFRSGDVTFTRECFISHPDGVLVLRMTASKPGQMTLEAQLDSIYPHQLRTEGKDSLLLEGQWCDSGKTNNWIANWPEPGIRYSTGLKAIPEGGTVEPAGQMIRIKGADAVTLILGAGTSFRNFRDISGDPSGEWPAKVQAAEGMGYAKLRHRHVKDFSGIMERVSLDLGGREANARPTDERLQAVQNGADDPALAALYFQFGRYLLLSSSRPGSQAANLQGIWNPSRAPCWGSKYTTNINLEMNYWLAEVANLSECSMPVYDLMDDLMITGAKAAKDYYKCRGWVLHHNTDLWRGAAPVDGVWGLWPMGAAWLSRHGWEHYRYTGDREFLQKRAWPQMKGAVRFILDFLVVAPPGTPVAGKLVTIPSQSPENAFFMPDGSLAKLTYGSTMDLMIVRDLFENCLGAIDVLGGAAFEPELQKEIRGALDRLAPVQISKASGRIQEWVEDYKEKEIGHRHMSHLFGLHPGAQITPRGTPELMAAARRSLDTRLANGGGGTGWSRAWLVNFLARMQDGKEAGHHLQLLLSKSTLPGLLDNCPPFQIDGNFGGAAGIAEMLLQSHAGEIELLPALPPSWPHGSVKGLRARGGFTVDIDWKGGRLTKATIASQSGSPCRLRYGTTTLDPKIPAGGTFAFAPRE